MAELTKFLSPSATGPLAVRVLVTWEDFVYVPGPIYATCEKMSDCTYHGKQTALAVSEYTLLRAPVNEENILNPDNFFLNVSPFALTCK